MRKGYLKTHLTGKALALLLVGSLSWVLTMFKSGMPISSGIGFWGANGHDGVWHLALSQSLARGSLDMPTFVGEKLQNYHIGFDILLAVLWKVTTIPITVWYFQILPVVFSLLIGFLTYKFVLVWRKSESAALWSMFFVYFGGDFGFLVTLARGQGIGGESMFWSQQAISSLINPPFALSLIFLLSGLIVLHKYFQTRMVKYLVISALFFGTIIEIKAYLGILVLVSLAALSVYQFIANRKLEALKLFLISLVLSLVLFLPLNGKASSLVSFQPFWFLETMLALSDRFYWPKLYEALLNWRSGHVYIKAILGYLLAFIIFILGNIGLRFTSLFALKKFVKTNELLKLDSFFVILVVILTGGMALPTLFVQQGTAWNTIQFFYYSLFVLAIFSGIGISEISKHIKNENFKKVFFILLILLTIPTSVSTLATVYLPGRPPAQLSSYELEALNFLKGQPYGIVLTSPFDKLKADEAIQNPPRPLYLYESTAYVSAYSGKPVFLEDEVNLTIMNYKWKERRQEIEVFYKTYDHDLARSFLSNKNIKYIYWVKPQRAVVGDLQLGLKNIFENKEVIIYGTSVSVNP